MQRYFLIPLFFFFLTLGWCQEQSWLLSREISFPRLDHISLDNQGFIFIADTEGNLYQYSRDGIAINNFSPQRQGALQQLEAFWTTNIFTFSADLQEYRILDRFINPVAENRIPLDLFNLVKVATLGNNNIMWLFDEAEMSLKQFDYRRNTVIQSQPLNLVLDNSDFEVLDIREYQNLIFLNLGEEGIAILDNQANFIRILPIQTNQKLSFWKNYLVYLSDGKLHMHDYQKTAARDITLPESSDYTGVMINQYALHFYNSKGVYIYDKVESYLD